MRPRVFVGVRIARAALLCLFLPACAAIEAENSSTTPIPPARENPFGGTFSSDATSAEGAASSLNSSR